ncbi:cation:proton antiporter, partial [Candidatus Woesebacteria bacterium]|nr:cation:proton antiporter [Candidatus Woesebacteria bacterium]
MELHFLIELIIFSTLFLVGIAFLTPLTRKTSFPYTVSLLLVGFIAQFFTHGLALESHIVLSPDVIFFVLLPILLFEGAFHINFHQFRLQFKTITAFATLGLLISIFVVAFGLSYLFGLDFGAALLFGAIISSTDPIAVLALFKHLGGPKRLALLADGESMFNDATGVVAFRVISAFILANKAFTSGAIIDGIGTFIYIFIGSILMGLLLGYLTSIFIAKVENDPLVESTLTVALALGSFTFAEHYFHLSGVITTVMAGITLSHIGRTRISPNVMHFIKELWGFLGFISVSLVFFFAAYNLNLSIFSENLYMVAAA